MPIPISSEGENVPLVTVPAGSPPTKDRVARARDPAALDRRRRRASRRCPARARGGDGLRAGEARLLLAAPAEARLDRVAVGAHVVAVQVEADLEPERVAGAEPAGRHAGVEQPAPELGDAVVGEDDLDAVLARCSPSRRRAPREPATSSSAVCMRAGSSPSVSAGDRRARLGALDGEHRVGRGEVLDLDVEAGGDLAEAGEVRSRGWRRSRRSSRSRPRAGS